MTEKEKIETLLKCMEDIKFLAVDIYRLAEKETTIRSREISLASVRIAEEIEKVISFLK